jgi:hypothetical protein
MRINLLAVLLFFVFQSCATFPESYTLGFNEALRVYTEFADGKNRGLYDEATHSKGFPDEDFDAVTSMVINWHRLPEADPDHNARLKYRKVHPTRSLWITAQGESFEFWHKPELINRVLIRDLDPNSVYEFQVREDGRYYRFRTMPSSLDERPIKIVMTSDLQVPEWNEIAHDNAKMAAIQKPDMFVVVGDLVSCEGEVNERNAERWTRYLDILYSVDSGYFLIENEIDGRTFDNLIIPHVSTLGNHETGKRNHLRWPSCVNTNSSEPGYPTYVAANWMELLFHWPYSSEGFYSEFNPNHPNIDPESVIEGFGHGGFGKLSFSDYLLLIALDNSQNYEGEPDMGLRDWEGNLITEKWPWYENQYADVRQDLWLKNLLEPEGGPRAGDVYKHILPVWHRGLFGTTRLNMSLKNRQIMKYWLPILYRNGVKFIKEGHDHIYTRTVPLTITDQQPENTYIEKVYYEPVSWKLTDNLSQEYLDNFYAVNCLKDNNTGEIVGWEYEGYYSTYDPKGLITVGHGGWAGGRSEPGRRGGGNAGLWYVDSSKGGDSFGGNDSYHINTIHLTNDFLVVESFHPLELTKFEQGTNPIPIHRFKWDKNEEKWYAYDNGQWVDYERESLTTLKE